MYFLTIYGKVAYHFWLQYYDKCMYPVHIPCVWYLSDLVIQQMKLQSEDKDGSEVMAEMDKLKPQVVDMATKTKKTSPKQEEEK